MKLLEKQLIDTLNSIQPYLSQVTAFNTQITQTIQSIQPALNILQKAYEQLEKQNELFQRIKKQSEKEKEAMEKSGWWMSPAMMDMPAQDIYSAAMAWHEGNTNAIDELYLDVFQENDCSYLTETVQRWFGSKNPKYFTPWTVHINAALEAHRKGNYVLTIPTLLLVAEGIAGEFCTQNKIPLTYKENNRGNVKISKALQHQQRAKETILFSELDLMKVFLNNIMFGPTNNEDITQNILNRHAILHGRKPDYYTVENSLKAFMILDFLSLLDECYE